MRSPHFGTADEKKAKMAEAEAATADAEALVRSHHAPNLTYCQIFKMTPVARFDEWTWRRAACLPA